MYTNRLGEEKKQVVEQEACFCSDGCMNQHFDDEVHDLHVEGAVNKHMAAAMNHTHGTQLAQGYYITPLQTMYPHIHTLF